ncbi:hypothetical protein GGH12_003688 [Coemansia sp. RSA 1822]|nr:hypothetical protein LPJ76_003358 [Coemansia sp. RSA 638]KAJ2543765.1 hypothetical protein GGF49_001847 [Coemansia sp. RSA 1853]KAJ2561833.1 hypothetical protein GGH12_003688 [Coemansia sp. RSA 1822]
MEEDSHLQYLSELQQRVREWQPWTCTLAEVADKLGVDPSRGIDHLEARNRHAHFGSNVPVGLDRRLSLVRVLAEHAIAPTTQLLLVICVLYAVWGEFWNFVTISLVAVAIIALRVLAEWRANRALTALQNSVPANTTVLRNGREGIVASDELVPGDVVMLSRGQLVPADAVVVACHGLSTDESLLTGESANVYKMALDSVSAEDNDNVQVGSRGADGNHYPLPSDTRTRRDCADGPQALVYAGTKVISGRAVCIVIATSKYTEIGSGVIGLLRDSQPPLAPLQLRLQQLKDSLSLIAAMLCLAMTIIGAIQGMHWRNAVLLGLGLAFATIPAEIPLIAKTALAHGSKRLSQSGVLVRKLHAADSLSSVSVIVTDKTGTLTRNQLVVSSILTITAADSDSNSLAVDVVTPEAALVTEQSAALAAPLYCAWSLSVDPLESRPLARLLASVQRKATGRSASSSTMGSFARTTASHGPEEYPQGFQPARGFGKDFLNTAVLQSLSGPEGAELPRDPETDAVPLETIARAITTVCQRLSMPTGELSFDPTLRISALTRSSTKAPRVYSPPMHPVSPDLANSAEDPTPSLSLPEDRPKKHWTVIKGAAEVLLPRCSRVWRANSAGLQLSDEGIDSGHVEGIVNITPSFMQTISRNTTDLAVAGNRVIGYAIAITDEPLFATEEGAGVRRSSQGAASHSSTRTRDIRDDQAFRFRDAEGRCAGSNRQFDIRSGEATETIPTIEIAKGHRTPLLPSDLVFVGAFAFFDPPQQDARPVVQECQEAGIRVIVATGDHPSTGLSVASVVGISERHTLLPTSYGAISAASDRHRTPVPNPSTVPTEIHSVTGEMIERSVANHTFEQLIDESNVFARVTPAQKLRLVNALRARGEVVAFIGDGINDAPPLTRADIGICMGGHPSTADVAMDAAGLIVLSGDFSGVVRCLREARRQKTNVDKALTLYVAGKTALMLLFVLVLVVEAVSPLMPVQLLLIALFMDAGAVCSFLDEPAEGLGHSCPRTLPAQQEVDEVAGRHLNGSRGERIGRLSSDRAADRAVLKYALLLFATCTLPLLVPFMTLPQWAMAPVAPSIVFLTLMLAHALLGTTMRTRVVPLRHSCIRANILSTSWAVGGVVAAIMCSVVPFRERLGLVQLDIVEWAMVLGAPLLLFFGLEAFKELRFRRACISRTGMTNVARVNATVL